MAGKGGNDIAEYVIRLGTDIDNTGISQLLNTLDTTKLKALGVTAAFSSIATGIYKFVSAVTKAEFELEAKAKKLNKSVETVRAEDQALKSMGKTLKEVQRDGNLKKTYEDLVKLNKSMELTNTENAMQNVRRLQSAFWQLKSVANYAFTEIGTKVLNNLEAPIRRITGYLGNISDWIKKNFNAITSRVATYISDFAKGIIAIGESFKKIIEFVNQIPSGIKAIGAAIVGVFALLNSGPLGQILAVVTLIGDIVHDFENFQWNKQNLADTKVWKANNEKGYTFDENDKNVVRDEETGKAVAYQIGTALTGIWEIVSSDVSSREKATEVATKLLGSLRDGVREAINGMNGEGMGLREWLSSATGPLGEILGGIVDFFKDDENKKEISGFVSDLITAIASALSVAGDLGVDITGSVAKLITATFGGKDWQKAFEESHLSDFLGGDNGFATGLATALETALVGGNFFTSVLTGALSTYQKERKKVLRQMYDEDRKTNPNFNARELEYDSNGNPTYLSLEEYYSKAEHRLDASGKERIAEGIASSLQDDFNGLIATTLEILTGSISFASDTAGNLLQLLVNGIIGAIFGTTGEGGDISANIQSAMGSEKAKGVVDSIASGIGTWIISGNFFVGLLGSVTAFLNDSIKDVDKNHSLWDVVKEKAQGFWDAILDIWYGPLDEGLEYGYRNGRLESWYSKRSGKGGLSSVVMPILRGEIEELQTETGKIVKQEKGGGIWGWLFGYDEYAEYTLNEDGSYTKVKESVKRAKGIFEKAWDDGEGGGIKGWFASVDWEATFDPIVTAIESALTKAFNNAKDAILSIMPQWLIDLFNLGEGGVTYTENNDGTFTMTMANGKQITGTKEIAEKAQELGLTESRRDREEAGFGKITGGIVPEGFNEEVERYVNSQVEPLDASFSRVMANSYAEALKTAYENNDSEGLAYLRSLYTEGMSQTDGLFGKKWTNWLNDIDKKVQEYNVNGVPTGWTPVDVQGADKSSKGIEKIGTSSQTASEKIVNASNNLASAANHAATVLNSLELPGREEKKAGNGGRFASEVNGMTIGEDGAEYVIPITKPERAVNLITQMLQEMGSSATSRIFEGLGLGKSGTNGASMASLETALSGMNMDNTTNINAPISINVSASGSNAQQIGTSIYDAAERNFLKTLRGVTA